MPSGGARARSGPDRDPNSARSEKRDGVTVLLLPSEGYRGRPPAFPMPKINRGLTGDGKANRAATDAFRRREMDIWREIWKTPQAAAWILQSWRWPTVGEYCRIKAAVELDPDSNAALLSRLREYRNETGLSPDGLKMNGWAIAENQVAGQAAKKTAAKKAAAKKAAPVRRLRSVGGPAST
jgi:hypothetical protein